MSKLCFVADCHIGNHRRSGGTLHAGLNRRCREVLTTLRTAYQRATDMHASVFCVLGDLYDNERPSPQMQAAVQDIFPVPDEASVAPMPLVLLGNHDMASTEADDHALGPLQDRCMIVDRPWRRSTPAWRCELLMLPYQPGPAREWIPQQLMKLCSVPRAQTRVLGLHVGLMDEATPKFLQGADDAIPVDLLDALCVQHQISYVVAGNWHDRRVWKRNKCHLVQVGTLCPTGWDNPGIDAYGYMTVLDTETGELSAELIPGPRFLKTQEPDAVAWDAFIETIKAAATEGHHVYAESRHLTASLEGARRTLLALQESGDITAFDARMSETEARAASNRAAKAVASSANMREALAAYIKSAPLPEGANRAAVHRRIETYLGFT